ncbi:MAG: hypothetical protein JF887_01655 [Candidatus Dormibacteraeota bacterium]|uniref:Restriction system protein n=1 Tax=Candidatus Amunia macphersoniae TaxID=3127014 RepID=A0A934N8Q0_9BACT|nr:hypothetical protein [Candidatus Dormibacteraeota bacterium]
MTRKRGLFAELHHQHQMAERRQRQASAGAARANAAAARQLEQARRRAQQAQVQYARATAAEQRKAEQEVRRLHDEAMQAEVDAKNTELDVVREEVDSILSSALAADPFVDLEALRTVAQHPPFGRSDLETPLPAPVPHAAREEPTYHEPPVPHGLAGMFGFKKKYAAAVAVAWAEFEQQHSAWEAEVAALPMAQLHQMQEHQRGEKTRQEQLQLARQAYRAQCEAREAASAQVNSALDHLIQGLAVGTPEAVEEYVGMVLGGSEYPESFVVDHDFSYDGASKELALTCTVPPPDALPAEHQFKYQRSKDEISASVLPLKAQRDRYTAAVLQVALRMLHEVFVADRGAHIQTIALTVQTEGLHSATGLMRGATLVGVAAERSSFLTFDLKKVVPSATLHHLGGVVSKNPFDMVGIDPSKGVRGV